MKISLKMEEDVPYTNRKVVMEVQIDEHAYVSGPELLADTIAMMKVQVSTEVDKEMRDRGVVLKEDGMIKEPGQN